MLRWLEKKAKTALFQRALNAKGVAHFYPKRFLSDVVEVSFSSAEREASISYQMGMGSDLDACWQRLAESDATVLAVNAMCSMHPEAFTLEALREGLMPSPDAAIAAVELSSLLDSHGLANHMDLVCRAFSPPD